MKVPDMSYRLYKPIDIWGWFMIAVGLFLLLYFGGNLYWILDKVGIHWEAAKLNKPNWWMFWGIFFTWCEYAVRVVKGRMYKRVYFDTITTNLYEIAALDKKFLVAAPSVEALAEYLTLKYPGMEFKVLNLIQTESFEKTESFF